MASRRRSRQRALQILFSWDARHREVNEVITEYYDTLYVDEKPVRPMRANLIGMALPLSEGKHIIRMDYRPLARSLYRVGSLLLEITLLLLVLISFFKIRAPSISHNGVRKLGTQVSNG